MRLPAPGLRYDQRAMAAAFEEIEREDRRSVKTGRDLDLGEASFILTSPDGSKWKITVSDLGALSATAA